MWRPGAGQSDAHSPLGLPARSTATRSGYVPLHPRASSSAPVASSSDDEDGESLSGSSNCSSPRFFPSEEASVALAHQAVSVGEPSSSEALSGKTGEGGLRCVDGSAVGGLSSATAQVSERLLREAPRGRLVAVAGWPWLLVTACDLQREAERAAARQSKRVTKLYLRSERDAHHQQGLSCRSTSGWEGAAQQHVFSLLLRARAHAAIRVLAKMSLLLEDDRVIEHKREAPQSRKLGKLM